MEENEEIKVNVVVVDFNGKELKELDEKSHTTVVVGDNSQEQVIEEPVEEEQVVENTEEGEQVVEEEPVEQDGMIV